MALGSNIVDEKLAAEWIVRPDVARLLAKEVDNGFCKSADFYRFKLRIPQTDQKKIKVEVKDRNICVEYISDTPVLFHGKYQASGKTILRSLQLPGRIYRGYNIRFRRGYLEITLTRTSRLFRIRRFFETFLNMFFN